MQRTIIIMKAILLGTLILTCSALTVDVKAIPYPPIVSDTSWEVTDTNGKDLNNAQNVCLDATHPSNCPAGATLYGSGPIVPGAWTASIKGATWIWAPGITGATSPADNAEFTFQKQFWICGAPQDGTISVAADNSAEVFLNLASAPILTSASNSALSTATIPAGSLRQGPNIIQVKAKNAPGCGSNQYQCNPAGVVLGASVADALDKTPKCTDSTGTFDLGHVESRPCADGGGTETRTCICYGSYGTYTDWSGICTKPTTCTDNGKTFRVNDKEEIGCGQGYAGDRYRICQPDGSMAETNTCERTCTDNGRTFRVNDRENIGCDQGYEGDRYRTCQPDGRMIETNTCHLPQVGENEKCGSVSENYTGTCPSGTECKARVTPAHKPAWWCVFTLGNGPDCDSHPALRTTDWYCLKP
jgi:hypothetical protein